MQKQQFSMKKHAFDAKSVVEKNQKRSYQTLAAFLLNALRV